MIPPMIHWSGLKGSTPATKSHSTMCKLYCYVKHCLFTDTFEDIKGKNKTELTAASDLFFSEGGIGQKMKATLPSSSSTYFDFARTLEEKEKDCYNREAGQLL
jgi:hypothetical protein